MSLIIRRKNRDSTSSNSAAEVHNADNTIQEIPPKKPVMNAYRSVAPTPRSVMMINPITSAPKKEVNPAPKENGIDQQARSQFFPSHGNLVPSSGNHCLLCVFRVISSADYASSGVVGEYEVSERVAESGVGHDACGVQQAARPKRSKDGRNRPDF